MNSKVNPNHKQYLETLIRMGPKKRLLKAFELSAKAKKLFLANLRIEYPGKTESEIIWIYRQRLIDVEKLV